MSPILYTECIMVECSWWRLHYLLCAECVEGDDVPHGPLGAERVPPRVGVAQLGQHAFLDLVVELSICSPLIATAAHGPLEAVVHLARVPLVVAPSHLLATHGHGCEKDKYGEES